MAAVHAVRRDLTLERELDRVVRTRDRVLQRDPHALDRRDDSVDERLRVYVCFAHDALVSVGLSVGASSDVSSGRRGFARGGAKLTTMMASAPPSTRMPKRLKRK